MCIYVCHHRRDNTIFLSQSPCFPRDTLRRERVTDDAFPMYFPFFPYTWPVYIYFFATLWYFPKGEIWFFAKCVDRVLEVEETWLFHTRCHLSNIIISIMIIRRKTLYKSLMRFQFSENFRSNKTSPER